MKTKFKPNPAAEARRAMLTELANQASAMTPEELKAFLPVDVMTIESKPLSPKNTYLVLNQLKTATIVGGYDQWKNAGRFVRKGAKSLGIWVPLKPRAAAPSTPPTTPTPDDDKKPAFRFKFASVFDISQTEPMKQEAKNN
jgi:hypothetical protein